MQEKEVRTWKKVYLSDLESVAFELRETIDLPALIILEGDVGAGKTSFVQAFLGEGEALSPTYSVLNEIRDILHADFYRIKTREEIIHLELELYLEAKNLFFCEWGMEHIESLYKEVSEDFGIFKLHITSNIAKESAKDSRNYHLTELSDI